MEKNAQAVVAHMMEHDLFSQWLGIEVLDIREGYSRIRMTVRKEMINGFGIVHGGIAFSLADSAFAFACNSYNTITVGQAASVNYVAPAALGDRLTATAREVSRAGRSGVYDVDVTNQNGRSVAHFRGLSRTMRGKHLAE